MIITSRERDLGGFSVRRILPYASHRMVGPFIFFDHMGPAEFKPGDGMTVRPHPHINLATVTYLFEGVIHHRDSLGSSQPIEPGAINWMTAGRGIVHSERTPADVREKGHKVNGIQCWVALPEEHEETDPSFSHHPKQSLPEIQIGDARLKILLGSAFGAKSPVPVHSDLFYVDAHLKNQATLLLQDDSREAAVYVVSGAVEIDGQTFEPYSMVVKKLGSEMQVRAVGDSRLMLLGGASVGRRYIFWNFVSSSEARLEEAKRDWELGPRKESSRFPTIPGDDSEFIPLPDEPKRNPKGTIL